MDAKHARARSAQMNAYADYRRYRWRVEIALHASFLPPLSTFTSCSKGLASRDIRDFLTADFLGS